MQILAKFVTLREDGNERSRWVYYTLMQAASLSVLTDRERCMRMWDNMFTAWADCVAYLEGRQCEKPAYEIGEK